MTRETDNALLLHGGTEDIDIPHPALTALVADAMDTTSEIESLRNQNAALEEANQALANRVVYLSNELREKDTKLMELTERLNGREFE